MGVDVSLLRFTHDTISRVFAHGSQRGREVTTLVDDLVAGRVCANGDERLRLQTVTFNGHLYSLNNRRLWALKEFARRRGGPVGITVRVFDMCPMTAKFFLSHSTRNQGRSCALRGPAGGAAEDAGSEGGSGCDGPAAACEACDAEAQTEERWPGCYGEGSGEPAGGGRGEPAGAAEQCGVAAPAPPRQLLDCGGEEFPRGRYPGLLESFQHLRDLCPLREECWAESSDRHQDAFRAFRSALVRMPQSPADRRFLDALPDKHSVRDYLVKFRELRPIQGRRVHETLRQLAECRLWQAELAQALEALEQDCRRPAPRTVRELPWQRSRGRASARTLGAAAASASAQPPAAALASRAAPTGPREAAPQAAAEWRCANPELRHLRELYDFCAQGRLSVGPDSGDDSGFTTVYNGARPRGRHEAEWREALKQLLPWKEELLAYVHRYGIRPYFKGRADDVLATLRQSPEWAGASAGDAGSPLGESRLDA
ncbi:unnamed protein product [Prorocentrum cordatum]|uniref:RNA-directed RNA polymerase n=1 Tax=Prorocentrum cordatum TaxID=2364126 RepID=A0ABN9XXM0_9DINO|nr:unnamed protein product [Polarella glacialis]